MKNTLALALALAFFAFSPDSAPGEIKVGIIGLDTSHVLAFTKAMNAENAQGDLADCRVVAAYPKGSPDIESSTSRVPKYTEQLEGMGIEIVPSIDTLLEKVDAVLLETNDGRPHLAQVLPVLEAKKRVFIDKPVAGSLVDAVQIFEAAAAHGVPIFSSSSLRFGESTLAVRDGSIGKVSYCETSGTCSLEKTHPDLFWYGIHGVEALFTVMGTGCESVVRSTTEDGKIRVTGTWSDGRTGQYTEGKFGGLARGEKGEAEVGKSSGYGPLVARIATYFKTGEIPVQPEETLEIYAFMEAADESKRRGGSAVTLESVLKKARAALPLVFTENFEEGRDRWETTDDKAWTHREVESNHVFGINNRKNAYKPAHRSPYHIALVTDLELSDFTITFRVRSTKDTGNHRDCCVFFNHQDPQNFYYVHLGAVPDPHSGQVMIVQDAPRKAITQNEKLTPWTDGWHEVKVVRDARSGSIEIYFDDMETPHMTANDKTFGSGRIGIGSFDDQNDFDDIRIYGLLPQHGE